MPDWSYPLVFLCGAIAGFINTIAGNGSAVSLAILSFLGLPTSVANGTNRLGVLVQSMVATYTFQKSERAVSLAKNRAVILASILGALIGSLLAIDVSEKFLNLFLGVLMALLFVIIIINPGGGLDKQNSTSSSKLSIPVFFLVGLYGGFIQAGVGVLLLLSLVFVAGKELVQANAIKLIVVLAYTIPVLAIFVYHDKVNWFYGALLAVGQAIGARVSANFALQSENSKVWIRRILLAVVAAGTIRFFKLGIDL